MIGRTRWRRFAALIVPATLAAGALVAFTAEGVLAASFAVSGQNFKVSAESLEAEGFAQFGSVDTGADGEHHAVAPAGIRSATLSNLCQSVLVPTPFGDMTLRLTAGGAKPVTATNLVLDADQLGGDATFTDIELGRDASTLDQVPGHTGPRGRYGHQAAKVSMTNVEVRAWKTTAGTFTMTGMRMVAKFGRDECF
jgi:hypothetical protein